MNGPYNWHKLWIFNYNQYKMRNLLKTNVILSLSSWFRFLAKFSKTNNFSCRMSISTLVFDASSITALFVLSNSEMSSSSFFSSSCFQALGSSLLNSSCNKWTKYSILIFIAEQIERICKGQYYQLHCFVINIALKLWWNQLALYPIPYKLFWFHFSRQINTELLMHV